MIVTDHALSRARSRYRIRLDRAAIAKDVRRAIRAGRAASSHPLYPEFDAGIAAMYPWTHGCTRLYVVQAISTGMGRKLLVKTALPARPDYWSREQAA